MKAKAYARLVQSANPKALEELQRRLAAGKHQVNVGFPGGQDHEKSDMTVAQIAAVHEFGSPSTGVPERPFLRTSLRENRKKYVAINRASLVQVLRGNLDIDGALGRLGEVAKGDVQKKITSGDFAPLKASTIRRKGSTKPLIDSGQMRQSVAWEIEK